RLAVDARIHQRICRMPPLNESRHLAAEVQWRCSRGGGVSSPVAVAGHESRASIVKQADPRTGKGQEMVDKTDPSADGGKGPGAAHGGIGGLMDEATANAISQERKLLDRLLELLLRMDADEERIRQVKG